MKFIKKHCFVYLIIVFIACGGGTNVGTSASDIPKTESNINEPTAIIEEPTVIPTEVPTSIPSATPKPVVIQATATIPAVPTPPKLPNTPVPLGDSLIIDGKIELRVSALGYDATEHVTQSNGLHSPPKENFKYVLAEIEVTVMAGHDDSSFLIKAIDFGAIIKGVVQPGICQGALAMDYLDLELYTGGSSKGILCFEVPTDEFNINIFYDYWTNASQTKKRYRFDASHDKMLPLIIPTATNTPSPIPTQTPIPTPLPPTPVPTATPTETPIPLGKSTQNPLLLGDTLLTDYGFNLKILSTNYDAWKDIQLINQFNDPPKDGMKYVLVDMQVEVVDGYIDNYLALNFTDFGAVASGVVYESYCLNAVTGENSIELYNGGKASIILCYEVPVGENNLTVFQDTNRTRYWLEASNKEAVPVPSMTPTVTSTPTVSPTPTITPVLTPEIPEGTIYIDLSSAHYINEDGLISYGGEEHIYSFNASKGQSITVQMTTSELEPSIRLYDPSEDSIAHMYVVRDEEDKILLAQIPSLSDSKVILPMSGIYKLVVKNLSGGMGDIGSYTLVVKLND